MKKILFTLMVLVMAICAGCGEGEQPKPVNQKPVEIKHISQDEAMKILSTDPNAKLLDCRFPKDFEMKHIPGAINFPLEAAVAENFEKIPDKSAILITYCGDGNRGGLTAKALTEKGYTNVYTMGGIIDWTGEVEGTDVPQSEGVPTDTDEPEYTEEEEYTEEPEYTDEPEDADEPEYTDEPEDVEEQ